MYSIWDEHELGSFSVVYEGFHEHEPLQYSNYLGHFTASFCSRLFPPPLLANSFPLVIPWGNVMYRELFIRFVMDLSTLMDLVVCKSSKLERVAIFSGYLELHSHGASKPRLANSFGLMALRMREVGSGASVVHMRGCGRVHRQTTCVWSTWRVVRISRTEDLDGFSYDLYATMVVRVSRTIHPSHGSTSLEVA